MTARERIRIAMALGTPDRVPVMCQLSLGHYLLNVDLDPFEILYTADGFSAAIVQLQQRYGFDGILVNLPGRPPDIYNYVSRFERGPAADTVHWNNGQFSIVPHDDNPHYYVAKGRCFHPTFAAVEPDRLHYVEPWDVWDVSYPPRWAFEPEPRPAGDFWPEWHLNNLRACRACAGADVSIHSEVFSPFSQFVELINYEEALVALMDDPGRCRACLERLTAGALDLALRQIELGVDAVLISSAFAGGGFLSRDHYRDFVLPYEQQLCAGIRAAGDVPVYTHTCGAIGDRLDLMVETGTCGIDTLDPPPLGTVELDEAKRILQGKTFIKGNIDPVNTLLRGSREQVIADVKRRLEIAAPGGGYILSSACSVAPRVPPDHLMVLRELAEEYGRY